MSHHVRVNESWGTGGGMGGHVKSDASWSCILGSWAGERSMMGGVRHRYCCTATEMMGGVWHRNCCTATEMMGGVRHRYCCTATEMMLMNDNAHWLLLLLLLLLLPCGVAWLLLLQLPP